jgi:hypothetical protein
MTLNELKTLLALNGNQRLPHLEEEIFADKSLYTVYVVSLCKNFDRLELYKKRIENISWLIFRYATSILKSRWPESELVIAKDRYYADWYNKCFGTNI